MITFQVIADTQSKMTVAWYLNERLIQMTAGTVKDMENLIVEVMN